MMKTQNLFPLCAALSVLFFMFTSDARAQEALDERPSHAETESIAHSGIPVEVFEEAQKTLLVITEGATPYIRTKYERALALLIMRAQDAVMTRAAFEHLSDQLLERAMQEAGVSLASQVDFDKAYSTLVSVVVNSSSRIRVKYERSLSKLISRAQKAGMTRSVFNNERDHLIMRARQDVSASPASQEDFDQAQQMLVPVVGGSSPAIRTKYERALNVLIYRAQKAEMTRTAFNNKRDQLLQRARLETGSSN